MNLLKSLEKVLFEVKKPAVATLCPFARCVKDGKVLDSNKNPGFQVFGGDLGFLTSEEEKLLLKEFEGLKCGFAFEACEPTELKVAGASLRTQVTARRVTGRPEYDHQRIAPWGYGDTFSRTALQAYPGILRVAEKLR